MRRDHFLPEDEVGYRFWREDDAEKFLAHAKARYADNARWVPLLYSVALNTGMRWGEIVALKWDAVYLPPEQSQAMITVKRSYCNVSKQVRETTKSHKVRHVADRRSARDSRSRRVNAANALNQ